MKLTYTATQDAETNYNGAIEIEMSSECTGSIEEPIAYDGLDGVGYDAMLKHC